MMGLTQMASFSSECLQIIGIDVLTEDMPKEAEQGADAEWDRNALTVFRVI